jgi:hypothetical protein
MRLIPWIRHRGSEHIQRDLTGIKNKRKWCRKRAVSHISLKIAENAIFCSKVLNKIYLEDVF